LLDQAVVSAGEERLALRVRSRSSNEPCERSGAEVGGPEKRKKKRR
jgi:hypothetical protein